MGRGLRLSYSLDDMDSTFSGRLPATPLYSAVGLAYTTFVWLHLHPFYHVRPEAESRGLVKRWRCTRIGCHKSRQGTSHSELGRAHGHVLSVDCHVISGSDVPASAVRISLLRRWLYGAFEAPFVATCIDTVLYWRIYDIASVILTVREPIIVASNRSARDWCMYWCLQPLICRVRPIRRCRRWT